MTVILRLQRPDWTLIATIPWEDRQSIAQLTKNNGVDFPVSCGIWSCGICKCRIIAWNQYVQIDKISMPMRPLERSEDGTFQEVFACIGGIRSEAINDTEQHEIILEKNI